MLSHSRSRARRRPADASQGCRGYSSTLTARLPTRCWLAGKGPLARLAVALASGIAVAQMGRHVGNLQERKDVLLALRIEWLRVALMNKASRVELEAAVLGQQTEITLKLPTAGPAQDSGSVGVMRAKDNVHPSMARHRGNGRGGGQHNNLGNVQMAEHGLKRRRGCGHIDDVGDDRALLELAEEVLHAGDLIAHRGWIRVGNDQVHVV